jgi:hypothetical protein
MSQDIATDFTFFALDELDVGFHAVFGKSSRKFVVDVCIRV